MQTPSVYPLLRRALFNVDAERIHHLTLDAIGRAGELAGSRWALRQVFAAPSRPVTAFGLRFRNPVGLAAGFDKDATGLRGLACLGFGHVEVGTVTPRPQSGNPRPRVFRLAQDQSLINRMGFPSRGADFVEQRLRGPRPPGVIVGVNIGKNKDTPNEEAHQDYLSLLERFDDLADYIVVNVSSPNTVGLRRLQARDALETLLSALQARRNTLAKRPPLLVKLAPDLDDAELDDAVGALLDHGLDGVVATNTTLDRTGLASPSRDERGGLSGAALTHRSTDIIRAIATRTAGKLPIIGVGGIFTAADARAKLDAGATLVQVYTGMIYQGPAIAKQIVTGLG